MGVKPLQRPCPGGLQLRLHQSSPKSPIHLPTQDLSILCPKGTYVMQYHTRAQIWMEEEVGFYVSNSSLSMCARAWGPTWTRRKMRVSARLFSFSAAYRVNPMEHR